MGVKLPYSELEQRVQYLEAQVAKTEQLEARLKISEERFRQLTALSPAGVYQTDAEGNCFYVNERWCAIAGLTPEEAEGRGWVRSIYPEDRDRISSAWYEMVKSGERWEDEYRFQTPQGKVSWVNGVATPIRDLEDRIIGYMGVNIDITERKLAEGERLATEDKYRRLFRNLHEGIWIIDRDASTTFVNARMAEMLGYTPDEMLGKHLFDFMDEKGVEAAGKNLVRREEGVKEQHDFTFIHKSGRSVYTLIETSPLTDDEGEYDGAIASLMDITDRRRLEDSLMRNQKILNETQAIAHVGSFSRDLATDEISWSDETYRIFGYEPGAVSVTFERILNHVHPDDRLRFIENNEAMVRADKTLDHEYRLVRNDGEVRFVRSQAKLYHDESGKPVRMTGAIRDITDQKVAEEELQHTTRQLNTWMENSPSLVFIKDLEGKYLFMNRILQEFLVDKTIDYRGKTDRELYAITEEEAEHFRANDKMVLDANEPMMIDETMILDGKQRHFVTFKFPMRDQKGLITAIAGVATEITDRVEAEKKLKKSERRYRDLVETIPHGVQEIDKKGNIIFANKACHEILGCQDGQLIGRTIWNTPADENGKERLKETFVHAIENRPDPTPYIYKYRTDDGRVIDVQVDWNYNFDEQGELVGFIAILTDITERRRLEESLLRNQDILNKTQAIAHVGSFSRDLATDEVSWSDETYRILGYEPGEVPGDFKRVLEHIHPDDRSRFIEANDTLIKDEVPYDIEFRITRKNGEKCFCRSRAMMHFDESGIAIGMSGAFQDITEQRAAEDELQNTVLQLNTWMENSPSMAFIKDLEGKYLFMNRILNEFMVDKTIDYRGKTDLELYPISKETADRMLADDRMVLDAGKPMMIDESMLIDDDQRYFVTVKFPIRDKTGRITAIAGVSTEITDRIETKNRLKRSEERYRELVETIPYGVQEIDLEGKIIFANKACHKMFGCDSDYMIGRSIYEMPADEAGKKRLVDTIDYLLKNLPEPTPYVDKNQAMDGRIMDVQVDWNYNFDDQGELIGFISVLTDITERRKAEQAIKASLREKEVLLREVHHRVKNNMQIISSLLNLQSRYLDNPHALNALLDCRHRIQSMALVHEMLYRSENLASIRFKQYIEDLVQSQLGSYGTDNKRIDVDLDVDDLQIAISLAIPCGLVISELLSNALKYAFPDHRKGRIEIQLHEIDDGNYSLNVRDDGVGLPEDFDLGQSKTFGLHLVKMLIENQLDGTMNIERTDGLQFDMQIRDPEK